MNNDRPSFRVPTNGIANTDPLDMSQDVFEEWATVLECSNPAAIAQWRRKRIAAGKLSDAAFENLITEARIIRGDIMLAGQMATKSRVEDVLMLRYSFDRGVAHMILNTIEQRNLKPLTVVKQEWSEVA